MDEDEREDEGLDGLEDDEDDEDEVPDVTRLALRCAHDGWHPALETVLQRLDLLTANDRAGYEQLLIELAGARRDDGRLVGSVEQAVAMLRAFEVEALRALYALGDSTRR